MAYSIIDENCDVYSREENTDFVIDIAMKPEIPRAGDIIKHVNIFDFFKEMVELKKAGYKIPDSVIERIAADVRSICSE